MLALIGVKGLHAQHNTGNALCRLTSMRYLLFSSSTALKYSSSFRSLMLHVPCVLYSCSQNCSLLPAQNSQTVTPCDLLEHGMHSTCRMSTYAQM